MRYYERERREYVRVKAEVSTCFRGKFHLIYRPFGTCRGITVHGFRREPVELCVIRRMNSHKLPL